MPPKRFVFRNINRYYLKSRITVGTCHQATPFLLTTHHLSFAQPQPRDPFSTTAQSYKQPSMTEPTLPTASLSNDEDDYSDEDEEDYSDPNPALNIKNCNYTKWGLVFYRTTYDAASAQPWAAFKDRVLSQLRASIRASDAPEILDNMDMVFVDDPTLEGASVGDLQRRFREWVREDTGGAERGDGGARHEFFVKVDEVGLHAPYVSLVRGFPEEYGEEGQEHVKIWHIAIGIELYDELGDPNAAWTGRYYRSLPTHLVAQGY